MRISERMEKIDRHMNKASDITQVVAIIVLGTVVVGIAACEFAMWWLKMQALIKYVRS